MSPPRPPPSPDLHSQTGPAPTCLASHSSVFVVKIKKSSTSFKIILINNINQGNETDCWEMLVHCLPLSYGGAMHCLLLYYSTQINNIWWAALLRWEMENYENISSVRQRKSIFQREDFNLLCKYFYFPKLSLGK